MVDSEHVLFFPVIVLVALILIIFSFKVVFRLLIAFLLIMGLWYVLHFLGIASPPPLQKTPLEKAQKVQTKPDSKKDGLVNV